MYAVYEPYYAKQGVTLAACEVESTTAAPSSNTHDAFIANGGMLYSGRMPVLRILSLDVIQSGARVCPVLA